MSQRTSGVLLHISSLPAAYGIGDLGPEAFRFAEFISEAGQNLWQMLPLNPTAAQHGNSPYHSCSAFAGNPLFISPQGLAADGWLDRKTSAPPAERDPEKVDYRRVTAYKLRLLERAYLNFAANRETNDEFDRFCRRNDFWLEDYARFQALSLQYKTDNWHKWPTPLRNRRAAELQTAAQALAAAIEMHKFWQFLFFKQWRALKEHCRKLDIRLLGDMPIYLPLESAEVWSRPDLFELDRHKRPTVVSGVPPDYFSRTGQLWGHPLYNWNRLRKSGFKWWIDRLAHNFDLFDMVRIDHFRGLVAYWQVPAKAKTAIKGKWAEVPTMELFQCLFRHFGRLPVIAEDLGMITADVREVMQQLELPGMRVLQFAFGEDFPKSVFLPHLHVKHCVVYTGTHDNNTTRGWYEEEADPATRKHFQAYLGRTVRADKASWEMIRLALQSVADTVIIPCQDLLALDTTARMNHPGSTRNNWRWRLRPGALTSRLALGLREMTVTYGRY